ncbi:MAG: tRNA pseudouridine(55) synthase TruB [Clostridia bacterium]|nr:tRNA pseudouridine(55) synthase TruB [Clostridia bacterium]
MNGFVNVIKPKDMSSALAVMLIKKKIYKAFGKVSIGHMGTLDPMASGVLPMGINQANRLFDYLLDKQKTYIADFTFGKETDTLDITGNLLSDGYRVPSLTEIESVLPNFIGEIDQIPPKYSAKNVNGKRGYELARKGVDFSLPPKRVTILSITLISQVSDDTFRFKIDCKGGTYIRSICRDIALALNTKATMSMLSRTASGVFNEENGIPLDDFMAMEDISSVIISSDSVVSFPSIVLDEVSAKRILDGVFDPIYTQEEGLYKVYNGSVFWGVGEVKDSTLKIRTYVRD